MTRDWTFPRITHQIDLFETSPHIAAMRFFLIGLLCCIGLNASAASAKIIKVLPHYLDLQGRHSVAPSLYDRDAYQAFLRKNPKQRTGVRFDVQWRGSRAESLRLRVEMRGAHGKELTQSVLETTVKPGVFSKWAVLNLAGEDYKKFGDLAAWRATLWDGETLLSEQRSFLW